MSDTDNEQKIEATRQRARRHKRLAVFWTLNVPPVCGSYFFVEKDLWQSIMLVYLAFVSIYALIVGHVSTSAAYQAEIAGYENP